MIPAKRVCNDHSKPCTEAGESTAFETPPAKMSNPAQKRPRLGIFGKSAEAPPVRIIKPNAVPAAALSLTNLVAQVLPESIMKSARRVRYIVNITSNADLGPLKSFRTDGKAPGPPFSFAYPTISSSDERRFASKLGSSGSPNFRFLAPTPERSVSCLLTHRASNCSARAFTQRARMSG